MALDSTTAITFLGVQAWDEGTEENFVRTGNSTAVCTMLCAWEDRVTIVDLIRGGGVEVGAYYYYTPSQVYPDAPFLPFDSIHIEGLPGEDGLNVGPNGLVGYKYARLRITYKSLDYFEGVTTGTMSLDYATHTVALPQMLRRTNFPTVRRCNRRTARRSAWASSRSCRPERIWHRCPRRWFRVWPVA